MTITEATEKLDAYCEKAAAEAAYNGCGSEEDISFGHAVANYERG
jgi:hypothetical protein